MIIQKNSPAKNILIVARWPLGGIRMYMRYMFSHFPSDYKLTLLVTSTHEDVALLKDAEDYGAGLLFVQATGAHTFAYEIFKELRRNSYDIILSQGFISAVAVRMANLIFHVPHILTIHGILEPQYLAGRFGGIKRLLLGKVLESVTVLHGVSNDILIHLYEQFPKLKSNGPIAIVIPNGIDMTVLELPPTNPINLRENIKVDSSTYLFGYFGRFMPVKGFDLLIEAVNVLRHQKEVPPFAVVAAGSGDYLYETQKIIQDRGMEDYFHFLPFQPQIYQLFPQVNAIVMPSRSEASPLLAMEALCMGIPLIASKCIGLRETISESPAMTFPSENITVLAEVMQDSMINNNTELFKRFMPLARERYNVAKSAQQLVQIIDSNI